MRFKKNRNRKKGFKTDKLNKDISAVKACIIDYKLGYIVPTDIYKK